MAGESTSEKLKQQNRRLERQLRQANANEAHLKAREIKYRALLDAGSDWINEINMEGIYTYVNPKVKDVLGYLPEEVVGRSIVDFLPKKEIPRTLKFFKKIAGERKSFSRFIITHVHKNGQFITLETNGAPFFDASGSLLGYWGLGRDITKQIRAKDDLRKSEAKWRSLVENAPNIILILDRDGRIKFINKAMHCYSVEDAIGKKHLDFIPPKYHAIVQEVIGHTFKTGEPGSYTLRGTDVNGSTVWYETQVGPLGNRNNVSSVILITSDITKHKEAEETMRKAQELTEKQVQERTAELLETNKALQKEIQERKRAEGSLQESELRFRSLAESIGDMTWEIDTNGRYTYASPKAKDLLGHEPEEVMGKTPFDFMDPEEAKRAAEYLAGVIKDKALISAFESIVIRKNGRRINVETSGIPVFDANGNLVGYRGMDKDITERVRSREHMFQDAKMVSLGTLVSGVAHEINNPITSIMLNGPILQKVWTDISPVLDDYCEKHGDIKVGNATYMQLRERVPILLSDITEGTKRVKKIVEELKNFSRQRASDLSDDVDLNTTLETAVGLVSTLIKKSTSQFNLEYAPQLPPFRGNTQRIEQVIINLMINACEALPNNKRSISVSTAYDAGSEKIILTVKDQGEGMLPEVLERIGDPFFTTKRGSGGTGLGLAISKKIIENHGGTIEFHSRLGEGTNVVVRFPVDYPAE